MSGAWKKSRSFALIAGLVALWGCSSQVESVETGTGELVEGASGVDEAALRTPLSFEVFDDDVGTRGASETRKVITSEAGYISYFGHAPPYDVDFYYDWVVFYSAGTKSTGGYDASVEKIETTGSTLYVKTRLESPGANCSVSQASTKPYVLAKFEKPYPRPRAARYSRHDDTIYCAPPQPETCADLSCAAGTHCVEGSTGPRCVADPCPGSGSRGSSGRCECNVVGICPLGTTWNESPTVCGCE